MKFLKKVGIGLAMLICFIIIISVFLVLVSLPVLLMNNGWGFALSMILLFSPFIITVAHVIGDDYLDS